MAETAPAVPVSEVVSGGDGLSDIAQEVLAGDLDVPGEAEAVPVAKQPKPAPKPKPEALKAKPKAPPKPENGAGGFESEPEEASEPSEAEEFELKANGKTFKAKGVSELKAHAQRGIAAQQQMQKMQGEFTQMRQQLRDATDKANKIIEMAASDPTRFFMQHAKNPEDAMEQVLLDRAREALQLEQLTPREREMYLRNKELQEQIQAGEKAKKDAEAQQEQQLRTEQRTKIGNFFSQVLKDNGMPVNEVTVRTMAQIARAAVNRGHELTTQEAAHLTKLQLQRISDAYSPKIDEMKAEDFVTKYPKLTEAIRQHLVKKAQGKPTEEGSVPRQRASNGQYKKPAQKMDEGKQWDDYVERLKKEGNSLRVKNGWY
jgi:hypothetical protein